MNRSRFTHAMLLATALSLVLLVGGCGSGSSKVDSGLRNGTAVSQDGTSALVAGKAVAKSRSSADPSATGSGSGGAAQSSPSTSPSVNQQSGGAAKPQSGSAGKKGSASGMRVRIMFWNDTRSKPLGQTEVSFKKSVYRPVTSAVSGVGTIGPVPYDTEAVLVVYPDGKSGKSITVKFKVSKSMTPNSEQDAIHVAVSDSRVRIIGNAVENFDISFPRF